MQRLTFRQMICFFIIEFSFSGIPGSLLLLSYHRRRKIGITDFHFFPQIPVYWHCTQEFSGDIVTMPIGPAEVSVL